MKGIAEASGLNLGSDNVLLLQHVKLILTFKYVFSVKFHLTFVL